MALDSHAFDAFRYRYGAVVLYPHDGDTVVADVDLGYDIGWHKRLVRFAGMNAAEITSKDPAERARGLQAAALVASLCPPASFLLLRTHLNFTAPAKARNKTFSPELEKYGRVFADVYAEVGNPSVGLQVVTAKLGRRWDGTGPRPWEDAPPDAPGITT